MSQVKYIVVDSEFGVECMIVFSEMLKHSDVAGRQDVISAGFISFGDDGKASCYGTSISLGISSRGDEDSELANRQIMGVSIYE